MDRPVVRRIDHLMVRVDGPAYEKLLDLFGQTFQLPRPWPVSEHPAFRSAGIFAGNVDLEILQMAGTEQAPEGRPPARLYGMVFESTSPFDAVGEDLRALRRRGVPYLPMPYTSRSDAGRREILWYNVFLGGLLGQNAWMRAFFGYKRLHPDRLWMRLVGAGNTNRASAARFFFDRVYPNGIVFAVKYNPVWRRIDAERQASVDELRAKGGGGIGLRRVRSVRVVLSRFDRQVRRWERLLHPHPRFGACGWQVGDGPAVELVAGSRDGIDRWRGKSPPSRRRAGFSRHGGIRCETAHGEIRIDPEALSGLNIRLVEGTADASNG